MKLQKIATALAFIPVLHSAATPSGAADGTSPASASATETIVLGGGCFWCTEAAYQLVPGVKSVTSGYAGGHPRWQNPTYEQVCSGTTGHAEVVKVEFDPAVVTLDRVLDLFWHIHDPTTLNRQGADVGTQYRSVIFYATPAQKTAAEASLARANPEWGGKIVTEITALDVFYPAEAYHQNYYKNNPQAGYCRAVIKPKLDTLKRTLAPSP
ncbi:peptide-methionine (S)-S-oxide reductase MsrA [Geminisphaera colitermitum]|uniref:peptide-methionine (S)-S-oxide reductase MsrA n=1 Tax=Geminisphaera colitermitum TaxID=1148786 RepID=UPI00019651E4|nr:peptide-methionine (S)-S-oxide reductase MsrA [Geminisphaera colitermitum]